jgi:hypothetical protein
MVEISMRSGVGVAASIVCSKGRKAMRIENNEGNGGSTRTLMRIFTASFRFLSVSFSSWQGKGRRGRDGNDDDDAAVRARAKHYLVVGF